MKIVAIKCGSTYLQGFNINESYAKNVRAIQTNAHLGTEYDPIFEETPKWMDCITAKGCLQTLMDVMRWSENIYWEIKLIVENEDIERVDTVKGLFEKVLNKRG